MAQFSDLTRDVFLRALARLEGQVQPSLVEALRQLVDSGKIASSKAVVDVIAKQVDAEAASGKDP